MESSIPTLSRASLSGPSSTKIIALAATFLASRNAATIDGLGTVVDSISIAAFAAFAAFSSSSILAILPRAAQSRVPYSIRCAASRFWCSGSVIANSRIAALIASS